MYFALTALIVVALLAAWFIVRRRRRGRHEAPHPPLKNSRETSAYHAVSIKFADNACHAARQLEGRRFLSTAAPRLPLPGCDVLECRCRFVHHKDRRSGKDRRSPFGAGAGRFESEQRAGKDRRANDEVF